MEKNTSPSLPENTPQTSERKLKPSKKAAEDIKNNLLRTKPKVVIFTDALSVLSKLHNPRQKDLNELESALVELSSQINLTLQWVPAHCGIHGNEQADRLAKEGGQLEQHDKQVSYAEEKAIIKALFKKKWKQQHPNSNPSDCYQKLNRPDQVILFRLRTGHNRLRKFKIGESEKCPCGAAVMNTEHLLQHCPLHNATRQETWPEPTPVRDKLHGDLVDLRRTASFVRATGVTI